MGSSPLTRGKRARRAPPHVGGRLIPAHAGKTRCSSRAPGRRRAHPRSRGENLVQAWRFQRSEGSSPLTRGKPPPSAFAPYRVRLIPAHAGKTIRQPPMRRGLEAHPRSRGENRDAFERFNVVGGSSPLTRGKLAPHRLTRRMHRLIPAHAGKTHGTPARRPTQGAHPRSRGENKPSGASSPHTKGSSPLTRGKRRLEGDAVKIERLIPAHAGKTGPTAPTVSSPAAHPRSRGENAGIACLDGGRVGSSPLTRGKPSRLPPQPRLRGLIPAHAGKTLMNSVSSASVRAHPRSRGENYGLSSILDENRGSSPLTRGKRTSPTPPPTLSGLIPAHAGKTRPGRRQSS